MPWKTGPGHQVWQVGGSPEPEFILAFSRERNVKNYDKNIPGAAP